MRIYILLAVTLVFVGTSCGDKVTGSGGGGNSAASSKAAKVMRNLEKNAFDAEWLEGKAKIDIESEKLNLGGTATVRIHKDREIWISVRKFMFEGARALVRRDSFFVHNRLSGERVAEPLAYIEEKYKVSADFDLLQEIFLGNAVFMTKDMELSTQGSDYVLEGRDTRYATRHVVHPEYRLKSLELTEFAQNRKLMVENSSFRTVAGARGMFPYERVIRVDGGSAGLAKVEMDFSKVVVGGPLEMPFRR